jgi:hypothetical protein
MDGRESVRVLIDGGEEAKRRRCVGVVNGVTDAWEIDKESAGDS